MPPMPATPQPACGTPRHAWHDHDFGQGGLRCAEGKVRLVAFITLVVMVVEVLAGWWTGSMALLADGLHMGGHALALGLAASAYWLTRRYAQDQRLSFGSGKILDLSAYTSALMLGLSSLWLVPESISRLIQPHPLQPAEALAVATLGLVVNLASAWLLGASGPGHTHGHQAHIDSVHHHHDHGHQHRHDHGQHHHEDHRHDPDATKRDSNLQAALMHVIADAITSVAAILGLLAAWLWGWHWLDPLIALMAGGLVLRWAWILIRQSGGVLLDAQAPQTLREQVAQRLGSVGNSQVADLHLWSVGQGRWTLVASVISHEAIAPERYKQALASLEGLHHPIIEIHTRRVCEASAGVHHD
jgi:cation diffusion facilitator family transporter